MIAAPLEHLAADIVQMKDAMREASSIVLNGFELASDAKIVRYPDRYSDPRGAVMWNRVMKMIDEKQSGVTDAAA
jgi:hypothetical protein